MPQAGFELTTSCLPERSLSEFCHTNSCFEGVEIRIYKNKPIFIYGARSLLSCCTVVVEATGFCRESWEERGASQQQYYTHRTEEESKRKWPFSERPRQLEYSIRFCKNQLFFHNLRKNSWSFVRRQIALSKSTSKDSSEILSNQNKYF